MKPAQEIAAEFCRTQVTRREYRVEDLVKQVRNDALETAAQLADNAREDEEYGHAAFRCIQIADSIRALKEE